MQVSASKGDTSEKTSAAAIEMEIKRRIFESETISSVYALKQEFLMLAQWIICQTLVEAGLFRACPAQVWRRKESVCSFCNSLFRPTGRHFASLGPLAWNMLVSSAVSPVKTGEDGFQRLFPQP